MPYNNWSTLVPQKYKKNFREYFFKKYTFYEILL